jgi:hypothetical protein
MRPIFCVEAIEQKKTPSMALAQAGPGIRMNREAWTIEPEPARPDRPEAHRI